MHCNLVVHSRMYRRSTAAAGGACSRVLVEEDAEEGLSIKKTKTPAPSPLYPSSSGLGQVVHDARNRGSRSRWCRAVVYVRRQCQGICTDLHGRRRVEQHEGDAEFVQIAAPVQHQAAGN